MKTIFLATILMLAACGDQGNQAKIAPVQSDSHTAKTEHTLTLTLNGDSKWKTDDHTRQAFSTMSARFTHINLSTMNKTDLQGIGTTINDDIDALTEGCTMQGDAHLQLHVYLNMYVPAVDALASDGKSEQATKVQTLLETYNTYFE